MSIYKKTCNVRIRNQNDMTYRKPMADIKTALLVLPQIETNCILPFKDQH